MPYFLGGEVSSAKELTPRDPVFFKSKYNVEIKVSHEVVPLDPREKTLQVMNQETGQVFSDRYDKLIMATGATSSLPPIAGADSDHVFTLRNIQDMMKIHRFLEEGKPKKAVIIGTGFIGLGLCENFTRKDIDVVLVEKLEQVTPGLDSDMAIYVEEELIKQGIRVIKGASVERISGDSVNLADGSRIETELVILAAGVKPNTALAREAGIDIGEFGAIRVNEKMETNLPDIYACGDCIEQFHLVTGKAVYRPLGSTANKTGRIAGDNASGGDSGHFGNRNLPGLSPDCGPDRTIGAGGFAKWL